MMKVILLYPLVCLVVLRICSAAGVRGSHKKWDADKPIRYSFDKDVIPSAKDSIVAALERFERDTCLEFKEGKSSGNHIFFTSKKSECYSARVGFRGGRHIVSVHPYCYGGYPLLSQALYQLGKVLGMVETHSRPDRDDHISVNKSNVLVRFRSLFSKVRWSDYADEGVGFDRNSIMIFEQRFLSRNGKKTFAMKNSAVSRPAASKWLSKSDVKLLNRMYDCPAKAEKGRFIFRLKRARNWPARARVKVTAVDSKGKRHVKQMTVKRDPNTPRFFGYKFDFGKGRFQYFRVAVLNNDIANPQQIFLEQLYTISEGDTYFLLCQAPGSCNTNLRFKTEFKPLPGGGSRCDPNPCKNGGECKVAGGSSYTCKCLAGFYRQNCELMWGELIVTAVRGQNLDHDDSDDVLDRRVNIPDPYVQVTATNFNNTEVVRKSRVERNNANPDWKGERLYLGMSSWQEIEVKVLDFESDPGNVHEHLVPRRRFHRTPSYGESTILLCGSNPGCTRFVEIKLSFKPVAPPPICPVGFTGFNCDIPFGVLDVKIFKGVGLPNDSGNPLNPFVVITAKNERCLQFSKETSTKFGTTNPVWDESFQFGKETWTSVAINVMAEDVLGDGDIQVLPTQEFFIKPVPEFKIVFRRRVCISPRNCTQYVEIEISYKERLQPDVVSDQLYACA
ncbi:hypothetical protein NDN08_002057 [Rhodosorus marinus]|uniref:Metalloendopeptidase n=1 Tax=Rhodosorus marinus TaxID=101924 RepID=A0AAV8USN2_9RHOD|nr:hypothetical protein NDN08_002057 [Rhodosorus marinus]